MALQSKVEHKRKGVKWCSASSSTVSSAFSLLLELRLEVELVRAKTPKYHREMGPNTGFKSKCEIVNKLEAKYQLHECTGILDQ